MPEARGRYGAKRWDEQVLQSRIGGLDQGRFRSEIVNDILYKFP